MRRYYQAEILIVVLIYALCAALWIFVSDRLVLWLFDEPAVITLASIIKGWLFVIVTSLLLYGLMRRRGGWNEPGETSVKKQSLQSPAVLFIVAVLLFASAAIQISLENNKETAYAQMRAIADFKTQMIAEWVEQKRNNAEFMQTGGFFNDYGPASQGSAHGQDGEPLQARLEQWCRHIGCAEVKLLDLQGRLLSGVDGALAEPLREAVHQAAKERQIRQAGPYFDTDDRMRIDFVVPLADVRGSAPLVLLSFEPRESFYLALRNWPIPATSGESLLFRVHGEEVHYLNVLIDRDSSKDFLSLPKAAEKLLATQILTDPKAHAVLLDGLDYRDIPVIGVANAIPGTDWFLLVKMDKSELYALVTEDAVWIGVSGFMALFTAWIGFFLLRQRQRLAEAKTIQKAQSERLKALGLLSAIADGSSDAIFAKDLEGRYTLFNHAAERITGKTAVDVLGLDDRVIFSAEQAESLIKNDLRVLEEGRTITYQEILDVPAGRRTFLATKGPLFDAEGNIAGLFGISRDITELKQVERELRDSEARFRALVEQSLAGIYIIQDNRFRYVNPAFATLFGYDSPGNLIDGLPVVDRVSPEDRTEVMQNIRRLVKGEVDSIMHYTFTALHRDGHRIAVEAHGSSFVYQGRPAVIGIILDITERKAAEDSLRESKQRFQDIVNASADWIWEVDQDDRYTYASDSIRNILGYEPEEIIGKTVFDFMPSADNHRLRKQFAGYKARHEPFHNLDQINLHKNGCLRYIQTNGMPILDGDGRLLGYRGLGRDVTERKQAELALRRSEAFSRAILDSVSSHIAVLDNDGIIVAVNQPWKRFAEENGLNLNEPARQTDVGTNYLDVCLQSTGFDSENALEVRNNIIAVMEGRLLEFSIEYPCHSPERKRWFTMTVTPLDIEQRGVVITHSDITTRKTVEETLRRQTEELEQRNLELQRFNNAAIGREHDMIALKRQVNELSTRLGMKPPFDLTFLVSTEQELQANGGERDAPI